MPFWIKLQRGIDAYNNDDQYREERRCQREELRKLKECRRRDHRECTCKQPTDQGQNKYTEKGPPRVRNLAVIPICGFKRTHYTLDNKTLYYLLCGLKIVPKIQGKYNLRNITEKEFIADKEWCWNEYFDMRKINRLVHDKKKFRFRILSNGQAVSIQYSVDKKNVKPFDKDAIVQNYSKFVNESGTDPGVNTWNATVVHNIETGKEVYNIHALFI